MSPRIWMAAALLTYPAWAFDEVSAPPSEAKPAYRISGFVRESGTGVPVRDVKVVLSQPGRSQETWNTQTGPNGEFQFQVANSGGYMLVATAAGLLGFDPARNEIPAMVMVNEDRRHAKAQLSVYKPCTLKGRITYEEDRRPAPNVGVRALKWRYQYGRASLIPSGEPVRTDAEGRFSFPERSPGDYQFEIQPSPPERLQAAFTAKDAEAVTKGLQRSYWPGGWESGLSQPASISSGQVLDVGDIRVTNQTLPSAVLVVRGACGPGQKARLLLSQRLGNLFITRLSGEVECNTPALAVSLSPGLYDVTASARAGDGRTTLRASTVLTVRDRNLTATNLDLSPGIEITGTVEREQPDNQSAIGTLQLDFSPLGTPSASVDQPVRVTAPGSFSAAGRAIGEYRLRIPNLPKQFYLKKLLYNGIEMEDPTRLRLDPLAPAHKLVVQLSDRAATIAGRAANDKNEPLGVQLVLARWPVPAGGLYANLRQVDSREDDGRFEFPGLAPGSYRLAILPDFPADVIHKPESLLPLLEAGKKVDVSTGGLATVSLAGK